MIVFNYMKEVKIGDMIYYINDDYAQFDIRLTLNKGYKVREVFIGHTFEGVDLSLVMVKNDLGANYWYGLSYFSNLCDVRYRKLKEISGGRL